MNTIVGEMTEQKIDFCKIFETKIQCQIGNIVKIK